MAKFQTRAAIAVFALVSSSLLTVGLPAQGAPAPSARGSAAAAAEPVDAVAIAREHLLEHAGEFGLSQADVKAARVNSVVPTQHNGMTNVYFQQKLHGLDVTGAILNVAVLANGKVLRVASSAVASAEKVADDAVPAITDVAAAAAAAKTLGLKTTSSFASDDVAAGVSEQRTLGDGGISTDRIPARLVYEKSDSGALRLAWELVIDQLDGKHWWRISMDADTGREVGRSDWVDYDGYNVYPTPIEAPSFGGRSIVTNPATSASPFGWHDTNGVVGAESQLTTGNNVSAYTDTDANNIPDAGSQPSGGASLIFDFLIDLTQAPATYRPGAVTNLFFTSNRIHDIFYRYGFDEAAGNFQVKNYGGATGGGDAVNAEAQDGNGVNNANFSTPPDGTPPRMQMYLWNMSVPGRDGDLDNGIVIHEYGHGISNRLTGNSVDCLENEEQAGEGWSDYFALMLTQPTSTENPAGRGIGTYALGQPTSGLGIRTQKYSTDPAINTYSYDTIKTAAVPHGVGSVWSEMLWEMTWAMVAKYGYDANLLTGNAGNNKALQLVVDGLKLQPCSPGFVDGRDAILAADQATSAGADNCLIWKAFAKRGLGFSATQGNSDSRADGVQAFDLPPACNGLVMTRTATPSPVGAGRQLTYGFGLTNTSPAPGGLTGVSVVSTLGTNTTYLPASATCGGTYDAATRKVTFPIGTMALAATRSCAFTVTVDASPFSTTKSEDDFEPDLSAWSTTHGSGAADWSLTTTTPHSPTHAAFATDPAVVSDQYLTLNAPVTIGAGDQLSFWHKRALEGSATGTAGFDGGVVEVSTDGGTTWADIGSAAFTANGYSHTISSMFGSPIAGRPAFSGTAAYVQSTATLAAYVGQSIKVRFRTASDSSVAATGWWVDDVHVGTEVLATNAATATADGGITTSQTVSTQVVAPPPATAPVAPAVTTSTPAATSVAVAFTPGDNGGSAVTSYGVECVSSNGGATGAVTGAASPLTVTALTAGKTYSCHARATNAVGTSAYGAFGAAVTLPVTPPPPVPTVPGKPKVTKSVALSPKKAKISFTLASPGSSPVIKYTVSCSSKNGGKTKTATGKKSPVKVGKLTPGKSYKCKVRATNAAGTGAYGKAGKKFKLPSAGGNRVVVRSAVVVTARVVPVWL